MDSSTIALHRSLLRMAKGMLGAYETWLSDQTAEVMTEELKRERAAHAHAQALDSIEKPK